jgi:Sortase domain
MVEGKRSQAGRHRGLGHAARPRPWLPVRAVLVVASLAAVAGIADRGRTVGSAPDAARRGVVSTSPAPPSTPPSTSSVAATRSIAVQGYTAVPAPTVTPTRLDIAAIGVRTGLQRLGLLPDGTLQPPSRWLEAGWFAKGIVPGQPGPAVIVGHIDSTKGPAVFYRLNELHVGSRITVTMSNRSVLHFVVDQMQRFKKKHFPTDTVYGPTPDAELRLVTCTGQFDAQAHSYLDNLVVSAHLV